MVAIIASDLDLDSDITWIGMLIGDNPIDALTDVRFLADALVTEQAPFDGVEGATLASTILAEEDCDGTSEIKVPRIIIKKATKTTDSQTLQSEHGGQSLC